MQGEILITRRKAGQNSFSSSGETDAGKIFSVTGHLTGLAEGSDSSPKVSSDTNGFGRRKSQ